MIIGKIIEVQCPYETCSGPAARRPRTVRLEQVADGVVAQPRLLCQDCGCELKEVSGADA